MTTQPTVHILPPQIAERIAAGEVVERPSSVAKELIENSLDAGATAISVEIRDGALSLIRVSDDGCGMSRTDAPLALQRFATSKIRTLDDLDGISTLGFRGEALSSIAAIARVEVLTRTQGEVEGTRVRAPASLPPEERIGEPAASPVGTSVAVRDLFYNTPARRKFLKSPTREGELVRQTVIRYALAYPAVAFRLVVNGRETIVAPPATPLERIGTALGREVAAEMVDVSWQAADLRIRGHISQPTIGRRNRQGQFFFVNGRPVRSGLLAVMLERPYAGRLPPQRRPLGVIHIDLDPRLVDVNVHPRKAEVRFSQERSIYGAVIRAVGDALAPYPRQEGAFPALQWPFAGVEVGLETIREGRAGYAVRRPEPLGQLDNAYIVARSQEGLLVVDQHAAHEQVLFEQIAGGVERQDLSPPAQVAVTAREAELLEPYLRLLADLGIEVESFGGNTFLVRSVPAPLAEQEPQALLDDLLEELPRCRRLEPEAARERLAMKAACTAAIKAGDLLTMAQMQALLDDLLDTWSPATCPHGRPAFVLLTVEELERRFMRR